MRKSISNAIVAGLASLAMAGAVVLPTTPASAGGWHGGGGGWHGGGGGWHGGGGGWHGGGWHGGGWHGGGWHGGGWHGGGWHGGGWHGGGWAGRGTWHSGYWRGGNWYGGWWGPAIAAGVIGGAAIAAYPYWGGSYGYGGGGCWQVRPTYDAYGNFLGQQSVNVC